MNLVFFGSSPFSVTVLQKLINYSELTTNNLQLITVITTPDKPVGRGLKLTPNPVKTLAQEKGVPVYTDIKDFLPVQLPSDTIALVAAYGRILGPKTLSKFNNQIFNIHPSLLPKYRGPSPLQNQILDGSSAGVTIMLVDEQEDHGPILTQQKAEILDTDTKETLGHRLFALGTDMFLNIVIPSMVEGSLKPVVQDHSQATFTKQLTREDGFLPYEEFKNQLITNNQSLITKFRAFYPWPGIWTTTPDGKRLKLVALKPQVLVQLEGQLPTTIENVLK